VAVQLGYKKVYRDPLGFPAWQSQGLPVARTPLGLTTCAPPPPGPLSGWPLIWTLLGIFAGGLALNLTPCVYPLIPITVSYFGGRSGAGQGRLVMHGLFYLVGLAATNSVLGVVAALTGGLLGGMLQSPLVLAAVAAVLVIFALSLFGLWELRLPAGLTRAASRPYAGYFGSLFMGLTLGVVAAPCIGPFVLGLLTWVASLGSPWLGFLIFFTLSLGLGLPLFILALFSGEIEKLPRSGEWLLWVRKLMGWVLLGMAAYFLRPLLPPSLSVALLAALALGAALHLGWLDRTAPAFPAFQRLRDLAALTGLTLALLLLGGWLLQGPGVAWQPYSEELLAAAQKQGKPVLLDFSAEWCAPCRELEDMVFHHPSVVQAARDLVMIRVDLTHASPEFAPLVGRYQVVGVPTLIFLDARGQERRQLRLVEYVPPDQMRSRMLQVKKE